MKKATLHCTIVNKDPNESKYKGRRGATLSVIDKSGNTLAEYHWKQKTFKVHDNVLAQLESERMTAFISEGWMKVQPDTVGMWEITQYNGALVSSDGKVSYKV